jgi:hypothetical protein
MDVVTDHQIVAFKNDTMILIDCGDGSTHATASRSEGVWTVSADSVPDVSANSRPDAITALTEQALAALPGTGYSTLVPHGLADLQ